ncbi:gp53-like domain-containing protein [Flavobacterium ginsenosidimutans]|uniref:Putative tail fiber protein gp53-like C-terminal domain-containing protein n=1 Tax=Flavobacterium ginsenosidimutans TaxID=687844 RepID=A0ABZ2QF68_9FLAO
MATSRNDFHNKFNNGDIPSHLDFVEIFDNFVHKNDDKADLQMVETGTDNQHYITPALLKAAFQNAGIIAGNCYVPYKEFQDNFSGSSIQLDPAPIADSAKVYKNGQLLKEIEDYNVNYDSGVLTFSAPINGRNIEINYWSKNIDTESEGADSNPILGSLSIPFKENFDELTFNNDKITLTEIPVKDSIRIYKNGQLLREGQGKDYAVDYNNGIITFSAVIEDRNIEVDYWYKSTVTLSDLELNTKYVDLTTAQTIEGDKTFTEAVEGKSFIKTGGTSSQFLMADGSVSTSPGSDYDAGHAGFGILAFGNGGYQKFSNGLILQWAYLTNNSTTYTFPLTWPNRALSVVLSTVRNSSGSKGFNHVYSITSTSYFAVIDGTYGYMFAIGY